MRLAAPASILSPTLVRQVRATFNDQGNGERPIAPSDDALFPARFDDLARAWRDVDDGRRHGVTSMMVGGLASLLTQMLHPAALAGVWDQRDVAVSSDFKSMGRQVEDALLLALGQA